MRLDNKEHVRTKNKKQGVEVHRKFPASMLKEALNT
jgi:hypothetical protein